MHSERHIIDSSVGVRGLAVSSEGEPLGYSGSLTASFSAASLACSTKVVPGNVVVALTAGLTLTRPYNPGLPVVHQYREIEA